MRGKLDKRSAECILLETVGKSYYKVFDPATSSTFNTKHVIFNEEAFPAKHSQVEDDGAFEVAGDSDHIEGGYESRGTENLLIHQYIKRMEVPAIRELNLMKKSSYAIIKGKRKMTLRL